MSKRKINLFVTLFFIVSVIISSLIYYYQNGSQKKLVYEKFKTQAEKKASEIEEQLDFSFHTLNALKAFSYGSGGITRDGFREFSKTIIQMHPAIHALAWTPKVRDEERDTFEQINEFFIYEPDSFGNKKRVPKKESYYPVLFIEPFEENSVLFGMDMSFEKNRFAAIERAIKTSSLSMTAPIKLIQNAKEVLLFYPIYDNKNKKKNLKGLFSVVIKIDRLISLALNDPFFEKGISAITIKDTLAEESQNLVFQQGLYNETEIRHKSVIKFAQREWSIEACASEYFKHAQDTNYALAIYIMLLFITLLISYVLYITLTKQSILIEANNEMRRFQNVAIGREERIMELKSTIKELQERLGEKGE